MTRDPLPALAADDKPWYAEVGLPWLDTPFALVMTAVFTAAGVWLALDPFAATQALIADRVGLRSLEVWRILPHGLLTLSFVPWMQLFIVGLIVVVLAETERARGVRWALAWLLGASAASATALLLADRPVDMGSVMVASAIAVIGMRRLEEALRRRLRPPALVARGAGVVGVVAACVWFWSAHTHIVLGFVSGAVVAAMFELGPHVPWLRGRALRITAAAVAGLLIVAGCIAWPGTTAGPGESAIGLIEFVRGVGLQDPARIRYASAIIERATANDPGPESLVLRAAIAWRADDPQRARELATLAIDLHPDNAGTRHLRAVAWYYDGYPARAMEWLLQANELIADASLHDDKLMAALRDGMEREREWLAEQPGEAGKTGKTGNEGGVRNRLAALARQTYRYWPFKLSIDEPALRLGGGIGNLRPNPAPAND